MNIFDPSQYASTAQRVNNYYTVPPAVSGDASLSMTRFIGSFTDPNYYGNAYTFGPTVNYDTVKALTAARLNPKRPDVLGNNFNFIEKVSAGYLMNTINLGRFRMIAGLRFENTSNQDAGTSATTSTGIISTLADGTIQTAPQNAGSAYVHGSEIAVQQRFTYLPGPLRGTGLSANEVFGFDQGSTPNSIQREFYKQTFDGGLRWSPVRDKHSL